ncbi:unnamed protein product [Fraxinus pennsylvanica]|uniref:Retrotransposon gag domain-containing protein n=1 Tax=Fraxinus pennsylvanica TaxID=56036 RepID=A0AAD2ADU6_9LAMI|nr:unnamed protein product [Fraxinus pennsylvanica]
MYNDSTREIWIELRDRYNQGNSTRVYELKKLIASISQENGSISSYFNRFKGLWEELDNYRPDINSTCYKQEDHVMQFLMGLDDPFSAVRSQMLLMDPLPSLNKVFALILQDERHKDATAKRPQHFDEWTKWKSEI